MAAVPGDASALLVGPTSVHTVLAPPDLLALAEGAVCGATAGGGATFCVLEGLHVS